MRAAYDNAVLESQKVSSRRYTVRATCPKTGRVMGLGWIEFVNYRRDWDGKIQMVKDVPAPWGEGTVKRVCGEADVRREPTAKEALFALALQVNDLAFEAVSA